MEEDQKKKIGLYPRARIEMIIVYSINYKIYFEY